MNKLSLSALVATTLWASAFSPVQAQTNAAKPAGAPKAAGNVVGSVNGKQITWDQVIAQLRAENPEVLGQVLGTAIGSKVGSTLFGPKPAAQVTLTKAEVLKTLQKNPPPQVSSVVQVMLRNEALKQEATKLGVNPSDADLDAYLNRMLDDAREQGQLPKEVTNEQVLAQRNLSRAKLRPQLRWQRQALNLIVKDMEKTQGRPYGPDDFVQAKHILVMVKSAAPDAKEEEKKKLDEEALTKIKSIREEITSGKKTFEQAAGEYGEDGTKTRQGDLGVSARGQMVPEFEKVAYALKPGELSEPVKTQFGYHLIKVEKKGGAMTAGQRQSALDRIAQQRFSTYLAELMNSKYKVVNNLPQPQMPQGMMGGGPGGPGGPRPQLRPAPNGGGAPRPVNTPPPGGNGGQ